MWSGALVKSDYTGPIGKCADPEDSIVLVIFSVVQVSQLPPALFRVELVVSAVLKCHPSAPVIAIYYHFKRFCCCWSLNCVNSRDKKLSEQQ